jgi:hypothetical protein
LSYRGVLQNLQRIGISHLNYYVAGQVVPIRIFLLIKGDLYRKLGK